jgi:hypothetical protein
VVDENGYRSSVEPISVPSKTISKGSCVPELWSVLLVLTQVVTRKYPIRPSLSFTIQQATFLERAHRLAHLALREVRAVAQFYLCDTGRREDGFENPPFVFWEEIEYSRAGVFLWDVRSVRLRGTLR